MFHSFSTASLCVLSSLLFICPPVFGSTLPGLDTNGLGAGGLSSDELSFYSSTTNVPWRQNEVLYLHGIIQYPNKDSLNNIGGADAVFPSQAWETGITEYLNLAAGHVRITSQVRPGAEFNYLGGEHGGATFAAVNQMYLAYLGSVNAQPEEGVEPGVYVNFVISTNTSNIADLNYIRQTALELFHLDFTNETILANYNVPWVLRRMNTQLGMWSQQVGFCVTSAGVGEEAPTNPIFYQTYIQDWGNANALQPIQAESSVELVFDPTCVPQPSPDNRYAFGFGFSFSIIGGFCFVGYLIVVDTRIKKARHLQKKMMKAKERDAQALNKTNTA